MNKIIRSISCIVISAVVLAGCQRKEANSKEAQPVTSAQTLPIPSTKVNVSTPEATDQDIPAGKNDFPDLTGKEMRKLGDLTYWILAEGSGEAAKQNQAVSAHYTGWFKNGEVFDSSRKRGAPFQFTVGGRVIGGWNQIATVLRTGDRVLVKIPPHLAYGPNDYGPIPGNSTLYFDMELLSIGKR